MSKENTGDKMYHIIYTENRHGKKHLQEETVSAAMLLDTRYGGARFLRSTNSSVSIIDGTGSLRALVDEVSNMIYDCGSPAEAKRCLSQHFSEWFRAVPESCKDKPLEELTAISVLDGSGNSHLAISDSPVKALTEAFNSIADRETLEIREVSKSEAKKIDQRLEREKMKKSSVVMSR